MKSWLELTPTEIEHMDIQIEALKKALREAILTRQRIKKRTVEADPAGNVYEIDWSDKVRGWAELCDLDLEKYDPCYYD